MMTKFSRNDLPVIADTRVRNLPTAAYLTRRKRRRLFCIASAIGLVGVALSYCIGSATWFARSGALITVASASYAYAMLRWNRMFTETIVPILTDIFTQVELDKSATKSEKEARAFAYGRVKRSTPDIVAAVNYRFTADHLLVAAIGTLVWGFGDLMPV